MRLPFNIPAGLGTMGASQSIIEMPTLIELSGGDELNGRRFRASTPLLRARRFLIVRFLIVQTPTVHDESQCEV